MINQGFGIVVRSRETSTLGGSLILLFGHLLCDCHDSPGGINHAVLDDAPFQFVLLPSAAQRLWIMKVFHRRTLSFADISKLGHTLFL